MMKRCNWRHSATTWFKRQGTVALLAAAGLGSMHSAALADVIGIGDVFPFKVVDGEEVPDLPQFGNEGENPALPSIPLIIVGGTGDNVGGTAAGQLTIDIPADTFPLISENAIIGGNTFGLGLARVVGLNSQWTINQSLTIGEQGQGFLEIIAGGRLFTDPDQQVSTADFDLILGDIAGSQGFAVVDGFGSILVNTRVSVGYEGFGDVQILNSARMETWQTASIGTEVQTSENGLGQGYVLVDGIGSRWNVGVFPTPASSNAEMDLLLGEEGRGTLEITNQARVRVGRDTIIGEQADSFGEAIVTGRNSLLWTFEHMIVGRAAGNSTGVVNINDKAMVRNDESTTINRLGTINLNDGTLLTPLVTNNDGIIRGAGTVDAPVVINNGDIRNAAAVANLREKLLFTGAVTNNVGSVIESQGGEMEFQGLVTNNGQIFGRDAIFRFRSGVAGTGGEMFVGNSTIESPLPLAVASLTVDDSGSSTVIGDLTLSGNLNMEIGFTFSKLFVTGDANLGGALNISLGSGFIPYVGQRWEIIAAGDVTGAFASVNAPPIAGVNWGVQTIGNSAFLTTNFISTPGTGADFNGDGIVNGDDLAIWQSNFGVGNPPPPATQAQGDANGDGVVDGADFLLIQQRFGLPPSVAVAAAVPEPSSVLLALAAFGLPLAARRRRS
ncbi:MAG: hypothetical protein C0485_02230 [Pirellula sp.]|nr:hypothetical protein [Pirellula sp.]